MEPAHQSVEERQRYGYAFANILGELGVVGRSECQSVLFTVTSCCQTKRTFGSDMDMVRLKFIELSGYMLARLYCQTYLRVGRAGESVMLIWC